MANNRNIALRISGTKQRQAGFAPLVSAGVLAGNEGENMDRVLLVPEAPAFLIKHAEDYILYLLIDRRVKSFDADAPGVLSIALTIGSAVQLAEGKSPYTLLMEVYDTFRTMYMTPMSDGRNSFLNKDADSDLFREILGRYPLEDRRTRYVPMAATKESCVLNVPKDKMEAFFRDTQYKEFASYGSVELGSTAHIEDPQNVGLDALVIPRPIAYRVSVNAERDSRSLTRPEDEFHASLPDRGTDAWEPVRFSLGEVLSAPGQRLVKGGATITLDPVTETVSVILKKKEVRYALAVSVVAIDADREAVAALLREGKIRILLEGRDITDAALAKEGIDPSDVIGKPLSLKLFTDKFDLTVMPTRDDAARKVVLKLTATRRRGAAAVPPAAGSRNLGSENHSEDENPGGGKGKFLLIGLLAGLIVGIGLMFLLNLLTGEKEAPESPAPVIEQQDPTVDPVEEQLVVKTQEEMAAEQEARLEAERLEQERIAQEEAEKAAAEEAKAKEEAEAKAKADAEAKAKKEAEEKAAAEQKGKLDAARKTMVDLINAGATYTQCHDDPQWQFIKKDDQAMIGRVLNYQQYDSSKGFKPGTIAKIKKFVADFIAATPLQSWGDLTRLDESVRKIAEENKK